jgi:hypothetical protein
MDQSSHTQLHLFEKVFFSFQLKLILMVQLMGAWTCRTDEAILMVPLGHMSTDKLNALGFQYQQPIEEAISDVATSLKEHGWLNLDSNTNNPLKKELVTK